MPARCFAADATATRLTRRYGGKRAIDLDLADIRAAKSHAELAHVEAVVGGEDEHRALQETLRRRTAAAGRSSKQAQRQASTGAGPSAESRAVNSATERSQLGGKHSDARFICPTAGAGRALSGSGELSGGRGGADRAGTLEARRERGEVDGAAPCL